MYQFGWFSTGRGKGSRALLEAAQMSIKQSDINAEIAFVFLSREPGESTETDLFIEQIESYHIPLVCFSYQKFKAIKGTTSNQQGDLLPQWRLDYDREVMVRLEGFHPDLGVLAGYMLIVGAEMCRRYNLLNLHPAALGGPTGTWQEVIWQLIERGTKESGVMMHLVTPELDEGPVATYCTFPIRGEPFDRYWQAVRGKTVAEIKREEGDDNSLFKLIRKQGLTRESPLIIATLKAFSQGKVRVTDSKIVDRQGIPVNGYNLTNEINGLIREESDKLE
jgi:folate-dependent phosphoribosylglycinamide formyltransferase PurN